MRASAVRHLIALSARSLGFLKDVTLHDTGYVDAVLVHARFDFECYTEDLFHNLALAFPPSLCTALPLRRAEFLAGRAMADAALQALGQLTTEIPSVPTAPQSGQKAQLVQSPMRGGIAPVSPKAIQAGKPVSTSRQ
ncbi:hypothetical protein NKJ06_26550 [Mesorhizobium sp. M0293]